MKTVHEISSITGISVRTLHYYDEIGLLRPTAYSGAGYRLYDDKALETLQQILFFREFDLPLREIKRIMEDPAFDRDRVLAGQRELLLRKKERLERLIHSIDSMLKGANAMDFEIFSKDDIETVYQAVLSQLSGEQRDLIAQKYDGLEGFHAHFMSQAGGEEAQRQYQKMVQWYGGRDALLHNASHPMESGVARAYGKRLDAVLHKLAAKRDSDVTSFEVKELVGEYDFVLRQMFRMKDVREVVLLEAEAFRSNPESRARIDSAYGDGAAEHFAAAFEAFYQG